jgi:DNA polymerase-3 subunit delta
MKKYVKITLLSLGKKVQLKFEQLTDSLKSGLKSFYLVSGDEPWQKQNAIERIIDAASKSGFTSTKNIYIENDSNWQELANNTNNISLFSNKQIFKVSLSKNKITNTGTKVLEELWKNNNGDNIIIFSLGKLAANEKKLAWIKKFDQHGIILTIWPIYANQMTAWIKNRAKIYNLNIGMDSAQLIANYTQNNLSAADQALLKITMCKEDDNINSDNIKEILFQQAKYICFDLLDPLAYGNKDEIINIINHLEHDPSQINILLYIIVQELEEALENKFHDKIYLGKPKIRRLDLYSRKISKANLLNLIAEARTIEKAIKGSHPSDPWQLLTNLCLNIVTQNYKTLDHLSG